MNHFPLSLARPLTRSLATAAALGLALALTACGGSDGGSDAGGSDTPSSEATSPSAGDSTDPTTAPTTDPTDEPTDEPTDSTVPSGDLAADAPTDASVEEFCDAINSSPAELDDDNTAAADQIHTYAEALAAAGTPDGFSDDARAGFEVLVDFFAAVTPGDVDTFSGAGSTEEVLGAEDGALAETFFTEAVKICQPELATDSPTPTDGVS